MSLYFPCDQSETLTSTHLVLILGTDWCMNVWCRNGDWTDTNGQLIWANKLFGERTGNNGGNCKNTGTISNDFWTGGKGSTPSVMWFWELNWRSNIITGNVTNDSGDGSLTTCLTVVISTSATVWGCSTYYSNIYYYVLLNSSIRN